MKARQAQPTGEGAALVEEHLGFHAEAPGSGGWDRILAGRCGVTGSASISAYRQRLAVAELRRGEIAELARVMTVGETYFFRDSRQFEALTREVLPALMLRRGAAAPIHVLSVACSTGEEPYSVAIAARELLGARAERLRIHAFDVNPTAIAGAERATYSEWALRATPATLRERYFTRHGNHQRLDASIQRTVSFEVRNLFEDDPTFWVAGRFDVIFCRNVLIYFSPRKITGTLARLAQSLAADGTLFLGHAETTRGFSEELVPRELDGTFCYRHRGDERGRDETAASGASVARAAAGDAPERAPASAPRGAPTAAPSEPSALAPDAWVAAIEAATRRLADLVAAGGPAAPVVASAPGPEAREALLATVRGLVARERFAEALQQLEGLAVAGRGGGPVALLRALILTNQGRFVEASDLCRRVLADDPHSAGAYHLLGVTAAQLGRVDEARAHHETAITLEPGFAMSHWLLGRLHLGSGRTEPARRHLQQALELWQRQVPEVADDGDLYAGGFGRDALTRLCRADLGRCEGRR